MSIGALILPGRSLAKPETANIKEGAWRIAIRMTIPNATGPATGPAQFDRCMNPNNLEGLLVMPPNAPCVLLKSNLRKDSLTWEMSCNQGGFSTSANGKILFAGARLEGEINTVAKGPQTINIKTNIEGRYLGPCVSSSTPNPPSRPGKLQEFKE
jgi:hypothetical protein